MLRALGVPAVLGAVGVAHTIQAGDMVVIDGSAGTVMLNPQPETLATARRAVTAFARERQRLTQIPPLAGRDAGRRDGGVTGESGAAA